MKYDDNGEYKDIYVKSFDTLPVGSEVDFDGNEVPSGWTAVEDILFSNPNGTSGTTSGTNITLSDNVANYDEIAVQVGQSLTSNATYIIQIDGTNGIQDMYLYNLQYNFGFKVVVSGTTLTFTENFVTGWSAGSSKIFKVIGKKKKIKKTSQYIEGGAGLPSYFTDEIKTGEFWIDGKPIYRKVFESTTYATQYDIAISNVNDVIDIKGKIYRSDYANVSQPIPSRLSSNEFKISFNSCVISNTSSIQIKVETGTSWSSLLAKIRFIIEYTKKTD